MEILDLIENNEIIITVCGKPLNLKDRIKLLEFLKNDLYTVVSINDSAEEQGEKSNK